MSDLRCNAYPRYLYKASRPALKWRSRWPRGIWQCYRAIVRVRIAVRFSPGRGLVRYFKQVGVA